MLCCVPPPSPCPGRSRRRLAAAKYPCGKASHAVASERRRVPVMPFACRTCLRQRLSVESVSEGTSALRRAAGSASARGCDPASEDRVL